MKNSFYKALLLEYITLAWNVVGCIIIIKAGVSSSSVSLFGFGIDSVIEIFASLVVIWQLKAINKNKEAISMKLIGMAFLLLAVYIIIQSMLAVIHRIQPKPSLTGIIWLIVSAFVMFLLAHGKKISGKAINNPIVIKEAKVTMIDGLLASAVLMGLLLTKYFGWWWPDIAGALILATYSLKEAVQAFS